jgi:hypothetical protein
MIAPATYLRSVPREDATTAVLKRTLLVLGLPLAALLLLATIRTYL